MKHAEVVVIQANANDTRCRYVTRTIEDYGSPHHVIAYALGMTAGSYMLRKMERDPSLKPSVILVDHAPQENRKVRWTSKKLNADIAAQSQEAQIIRISNLAEEYLKPADFVLPETYEPHQLRSLLDLLPEKTDKL